MEFFEQKIKPVIPLLEPGREKPEFISSLKLSLSIKSEINFITAKGE